MLSKHIPIVIDWFGPYSKEEVQARAESDFGGGLYMLYGKVKYQKTPAKLPIYWDI